MSIKLATAEKLAEEPQLGLTDLTVAKPKLDMSEVEELLAIDPELILTLNKYSAPKYFNRAVVQLKAALAKLEEQGEKTAPALAAPALDKGLAIREFIEWLHNGKGIFLCEFVKEPGRHGRQQLKFIEQGLKSLLDEFFKPKA
jgi:hypothetical protein